MTNDADQHDSVGAWAKKYHLTSRALIESTLRGTTSDRPSGTCCTSSSTQDRPCNATSATSCRSSARR